MVGPYVAEKLIIASEIIDNACMVMINTDLHCSHHFGLGLESFVTGIPEEFPTCPGISGTGTREKESLYNKDILKFSCPRIKGT